jgi:signal transduction histidine kinase
MTASDRDGPQAAPLDAAYLEALFAGARLAIIACDPAGRLLTWNAAAASLFRQLGPSDQGQPVSSLFPESERPAIEAHVRFCAATLEPQEFDWTAPSSAETPPIYGVWCTPVLRADGTAHGVALWFRDITQRVRLKAAVERKRRLSTLGTLAGAVAHHYNNFLCGIATSMEFAAQMSSPAAMRQALRRSLEAVTRAAEVNHQLLAFAQADHRETTLCDLTEAVLFYFDEHEERLRARQIRLRLDWQRIPVMPVPRAAVQMVVDALVQNAIDAMPEGGQLAVTLGLHDDHHVALSVTDTGPGISPPVLERIFEPFFTTKGVLGQGQARNAGMGLAVVHGLVSEMGGTVAAGNVSGGGARFEIILPLNAAAP